MKPIVVYYQGSPYKVTSGHLESKVERILEEEYDGDDVGWIE